MKKDKSIVIDIGGTTIKIATVTNGKIEKFKSIPSHSEGKLSDRLSDIEKNVREIAGNLSEYCGIGISLPCLVDPVSKRATEIYSKFEDAPFLDLSLWAKQKFGLPIAVGQDSKMALLGEVNYGCAKGYKDVVMVIMGTGVGTAVMIDGRLLEGKRFSSGALGSHIVIEMVNGRKCTCKSRGCLEAYTASWALPEIIKSHKDYSSSILRNVNKPDYKDLHAAVLSGDRVATDVLNGVIRAMRAGIISFIHAYSPEAIVFSGGPLNMGKIFTDPLFERINDVVWGKEEVKFLIADNPNVSVALGLHYTVIGRQV